jgi:hypothetical protein
VSDGTNLVAGQYINVEVSSSFERGKISTVVGDVVTLTSALSGAPDTPGEVRNTRQLIVASDIQKLGVYIADDIASLKSVDITYAPNGLKYQVTGKGIYRYASGSGATADDLLVVAPTAGSGRWLLEEVSVQNTAYSAGMLEAADLTALAAISDAALSSGQLARVPAIGIYRWQTGTSLTADGRWIVNGASTGQWKLEYLPEGIIDTKTTHGFAVKNCIRHDGTNWVKAQGNSIAGSTGVRLVVAVPSTNTYVALDRGIVTVPGHGLVVGTQYYLDPDSAGGLVASKPVGSESRPLGYFLPVLKVLSTTQLQINIPPLPTFNPIYAEKVASGTSTTTISFTNLSLNNVGNRIRVDGTARSTSGASRGEIQMSFPSEAAGAGDYAHLTSHPTATTTQTFNNDTSDPHIVVGCSASSTDDMPFTFEGNLRRVHNQVSSPSSYDWLYGGSYTSLDSTDVRRGHAAGHADDEGTNLTRIDFAFSNAEHRTGDYIRLLIDSLPDA